MAQRPARRRGKAPARIRPRRPLTVDFHTHMTVPEVYAFVQDALARGAGPPRPFVSRQSKAFQDRQYRAIAPRMNDAAVKLRDMDAAGIDIQVVSIELNHYCYWAPPEKGLEIARLCNDRMAELVALAPDRLVGLATVPLQDPPRAARELDRAVTRLGLRGVIVGSHAEGRELGDRALRRFWARAEALGVPVFVHPAGTTSPERLARYFMWNSVGQPLEETMALCSLIYDGVLDAFPRLKVVFAHGGGYLPYYAGRADRAFERRPESRRNITAKPSAYLRRIYFDTCVYNRDMLEFLAAKVGAGRIVMGSDYPLYLGEDDPVAFVNRARTVSKDGKARILGANAARLLRISV